MFSIRFVTLLLVVSSALATPLSAKRQPWNPNLYIRGNSSQSSNSSSSDSSNNNSSNNNSSSSISSSNNSSSSNSSNNNSSNNNSSSSNNNSNNNSNNSGSNVSLNNYGGLQSMSGFDNFYGSGNFDGSQNSQTIVVQEKEVVCHTQQIEIIQQKLVVLQELAKKIVTEQICEVETQTIVLEQFSSGFSSFQNDIGRKSGKQVGYDSKVASLASNLTNPDGSLSTSDLGFNGTSVGSNTVVPSGNNWNDTQGPDVVAKAQAAADSAAGKNSTSS